MILREGRTPSGREVRAIIKQATRHIRRAWPGVRILWRGDSHYARPEAMDWCEEAGVDYLFGLAGNEVLARHVRAAADDLCVRRAEADADRMRTFSAFAYAAKSWCRERHVVARLEATRRGCDTRFVATSLAGEPADLYERLYCARGQAENLIMIGPHWVVRVEC